MAHRCRNLSSELSVSEEGNSVKRSWVNQLADWGKYAAAAGAALATGASAEAGIVYVHPASPEDAKVPGVAPYIGNAVKQFTVDGIGLELNAGTGTSYQGRFARLRSTGTKHLNWNTGTAHLALGFSPDQSVRNLFGSGANNFGFTVSPRLAAHETDEGGNFGSGPSNFAGFRLPASKGGGTGWMRFLVSDRDNDGYVDEVQAIDWAYDDAGGIINAGQVPEPSSAALALLAAGSAGVLAWRQRRPIKP